MKGEVSMNTERSKTFNKWTDANSNQTISPVIVSYSTSTSIM